MKKTFYTLFLSIAVVLALGAIPAALIHNNLDGLQGGATDEYYHLTEINYNQIDNWSTAFGWGDHNSLYLAIDHDACDVTSAKISNWDVAFGWGDHSSESYLKNIVEDTSPQLGGDLDVNDHSIINALGAVNIKPDNETEYLEISWVSADNILLKAIGSAGADLLLGATDDIIIEPDDDLFLRPIGGVRFQPSGDLSDYWITYTEDDIPHIQTVGGCDFHFISSGGTFDFDDDNLTTSGHIITTGGTPLKTGKFLTGSAGNTVFSFSGNNFDIRAGDGTQSIQNVMRVDNSGNFDFQSGNLTTTGTITAEQLTSTDDITAGDNLIASTGFVGAPSHTFTGYPTTGMWYQPGGSGLSFAEGGVNRLSLTSLGAHFNTGALSGVTNITASGIIKVSDGSVGAPSFASTTEPTTGIYFGPLGITINLTTEGTRVFSSSDTGADFYVPLDLKANALTVNSNEIVGSDGEVNKNVIEDSPNWDAAYDHIHNLTTDIDHDALTNFEPNEHIDWTNTASNFLTSGTLASGAQTITGTLTTTSYFRPGHAIYGLETYSPKIEGDVSGVTSRVWMRPDGGNKHIALIFAPSGTEDGASFQLQNVESATDRGRLIFNIVGTTAEIKTGYQGTGSAPTLFTIGEYNVGTPALATIAFRFDGVNKAEISDAGLVQADGGFQDGANAGIDATLTFGGGGSGDCNSITISGGIITAYTTIP